MCNIVCDTADIIITKISKLRAFQKLYFSTRDKNTLETCKILEKQLDQDLKIYNTLKQNHEANG